MKLKINALNAIVYSDLFGFPLTRDEIRLWNLSDDSHKLARSLRGYENLIQSEQGYYFLKGREKLVGQRKKREKISKKKLIKLTQLIKLIKLIPTIAGIFLTGSVAAGNAKVGADLDLMIVAYPNCLWLTRLFLVTILKIRKEYRGKWGDQGNYVCTNIFLDLNHLEINDKNLYTAHEVLLAKCVFDRGGVQKKWLMENKWAAKYVPNAYESIRLSVSERAYKKGFSPLSRVIYWLLFFPETVVYSFQLLYMRGKVTNEKIGWGYAFFHPRNLSLEIMIKFERKMKKILA